MDGIVTRCMDSVNDNAAPICFGAFELDTATGELRKRGVKLRLPDQAYRVLRALLEHPGEVVTRAQLQERVWSDRTFGDFESAINKCISQLRTVLGDSGQNPRFIETLAKRGYRFIAPSHAPRVSEQTMAVRRQSNETHRPPSIAVLPFENMSDDKENEYFGDGLAEEILQVLNRISGLKVIARTSAFAFKGKHEDVRRIAAALDVETVLEGSVRRAGSRIRVTAQLITAVDGSLLWSERYEREIADVFAIQDDIAHAIASALRVQPSLRPRSTRHTPTLSAYEAVLEGRHHMLRGSREAMARAQRCFKQAIALDPEYAEPQANLGLSHFLASMMFFGSLRETVSLIRTAAQEALRLDPSEFGPHLLLGVVAAAYDFDWDRASEHFTLATSGASIPVEAHWAYASLFFQPLGHFQQAVTEMERAVARDPLNGFWHSVLVSHLTHAELYDRAIEQGQEALRIDATSFAPYFTLGEAYASTDRWSQAIGVLERAHELSPHEAMTTGLLAGALVRIGETRRAAHLAQELGEAPRPLIGRVLYHVVCLEADRAADWYTTRAHGARSVRARVRTHAPPPHLPSDPAVAETGPPDETA